MVLGFAGWVDPTFQRSLLPMERKRRLIVEGVGMCKICLALLIVLTVETGAQDLREGDLVFQTSQSRQSMAIRRVTRSPLTHVGVVVQERGQWFVAEAIGPVQLTPYPLFLARGEGTKVLIKRWRAGLSPTQMSKMRGVGNQFMGLPYDELFRWGDDKIYCSELVWKVYQRGAGVRLGEPQKFGQLDLSSGPAQTLVRERGRPATSEPVVTPAALAACQGLVTVKDSYR